jgi:hypothetical protein
MKLKDFGQELDERVLAASASMARVLHRRTMLVRILQGSAATVAALTVGTFTGVKDSFAAVSCSHCGRWFGHGCSGCSPECSGCPANGCPSGRSVCKRGQCGPCEYSDGEWVACTGGGRCGGAFRLCWDCKNRACNVCTCLSVWLCTGCCSEADVRETMAQALAAAN